MASSRHQRRSHTDGELSHEDVPCVLKDVPGIVTEVLSIITDVLGVIADFPRSVVHSLLYRNLAGRSAKVTV